MSADDSVHEHSPGGYSEEAWQEWKDYADQVSIQVQFKSWAGADDAEAVWLVQSEGAAWTKDWLSHQLVNLAAADAANSCCGRGNYMLETRETKHEWGASAAGFEAILTLSENLLAEATWVALGALAQKLSTRLKQQHPEWLTEDSISDEQAHACAAWTVETVSGVDFDSLAVRSTEYLDDSVLIELLDPSGCIYLVEVQTRGDFVRMSRIRKVTRPESETGRNTV